MASIFMPDLYFPAFRAFTPELLRSIGVRALILDVDNTLAPYEEALPSDEVKAWLGALADAGIRCGIVSNNRSERIALFNRDIGLPIICSGGKPFPHSVVRMMRLLGAKKEETALLGDQIFTDVLAAKCAGVRAFLVPPIRDRRDILTKAKRFFERPILERSRKAEEKRNQNTGDRSSCRHFSARAETATRFGRQVRSRRLRRPRGSPGSVLTLMNTRRATG